MVAAFEMALCPSGHMMVSQVGAAKAKVFHNKEPRCEAGNVLDPAAQTHASF